MAIEKITAIENVDKILKDENTDVVVSINMTTADAIIEDEKNSEKVEEIISELEKEAEVIITPNPEAPEVKAKNIYTKLTLDESIEDFKMPVKKTIKEQVEETEQNEDRPQEDDYLDYDMFNFVYGIVTDDYPKPKNPLDHKIRRFEYNGEDNYEKNIGVAGDTQVAVDVEGNIDVYGVNEEDFADAIAVCDHYDIKHTAVQKRTVKDVHWPYTMKIFVPNDSNGMPMGIEEYFAPKGLTVQDVIETTKTSDWGKTYTNKVNKDIKDALKKVNDDTVEAIYQKAVKTAAWGGDEPIETFVKMMLKELEEKKIVDADGNEHKLTYSKKKLADRLKAEFEDDFEDEE